MPPPALTTSTSISSLNDVYTSMSGSNEHQLPTITEATTPTQSLQQRHIQSLSSSAYTRSPRQYVTDARNRSYRVKDGVDDNDDIVDDGVQPLVPTSVLVQPLLGGGDAADHDDLSPIEAVLAPVTSRWSLCKSIAFIALIAPVIVVFTYFLVLYVQAYVDTVRNSSSSSEDGPVTPAKGDSTEIPIAWDDDNTTSWQSRINRVQQTNNASYTILAVGDSFTQGTYGTAHHPYTLRLLDLLNNKYPLDRFRIDNVAVNEACIVQTDCDSWIGHQIVNATQLSNYSIVIVNGGTNDIQRWQNSTKTADELWLSMTANVTSIYELVTATGAQLITLSIPQVGAKPADRHSGNDVWSVAQLQLRASINQFEADYKPPALSGQTPTHTHINLDAELPRWTLTDDELSSLWYDSYTPSPVGYDLLGTIVYNAIDKLLAVR